MHKTLFLGAAFSLALPAASWAGAVDPAETRAKAVEAKMTPDERVIMTHGIMALPLAPGMAVPPEAVLGAGYVAGVPRLGVPALTETDASLGVAFNNGARGPEGATPLPSGLAQAATWNPTLVRQGGATIGAEAKAKGFNVLLAGGANLMRDPRNGRAFEYFGEDPLLSGVLAGEAIAGIQSNHIISTVKHFALNDQETARGFIDARVSDAHARESDLLAFQIAIERGKPGSVMCAYNQVNGAYACGNDYLLNRVLKRDWGFKGFVMSDWGAVHGLEFAINGLDQQSGAQLDPQTFFAAPLKQTAASDPHYATRLTDMNRRILYAIYANGLDSSPPVKKPLDAEAGLLVADQIARQGIVLLRNQSGALPLAGTVKRIAVIGGYADTGVLSGGGSSQVQMTGGPAASVSVGGEGPFAAFVQETYHRSVPLNAIRKKAPSADVTFVRGNYLTDAVVAAKNADVAIIFATGWRSEGFDVPDLSLPNGQDALIAAVAKSNPNTIVVLETGGPVLMPWLKDTAAVLEAWYPGGRGGEAIASVLFGETNPSGRLPATFPAGLDQLPQPALPGLGTVRPDIMGRPKPGESLSVNYDVEGSDVGYRWNARQGQKALFPFGFGLTYTSFERIGLTVSGLHARFAVINSGRRAGADVAQLYLVERPGGPKQRLVAFQRVELTPGERREISLDLDPRLLADWTGEGWAMKGGTYRFALGADAEHLGSSVSVSLPARRWRD